MKPTRSFVPIHLSGLVSQSGEQEENPTPFLSRRHFLQRTLTLGASLLVAPVFLSGCGSSEPAASSGSNPSSDTAASTSNEAGATCDTTGEGDEGIRKALVYVDESPHADKDCATCRFYKAAASGEDCGGCEIITGPIAPGGYCNSWVERPA